MSVQQNYEPHVAIERYIYQSAPSTKHKGKVAIYYEDHGFWGGMTTYQRAHERARRRIFLANPEYGQREIFH